MTVLHLVVVSHHNGFLALKVVISRARGDLSRARYVTHGRRFETPRAEQLQSLLEDYLLRRFAQRFCGARCARSGSIEHVQIIEGGDRGCQAKNEHVQNDLYYTAKSIAYSRRLSGLISVSV